MRKQAGVTKVNDDEWYTPYGTALKVAEWLASALSLDTPILCPADLPPDGSESAIPEALRAVGFRQVRVTRDLPVSTQEIQDWLPGEVIVTNPPFSLLVPFRRWALASGSRFCILSRPGEMRSCWNIPELGSRFKSTDGRSVAAAWVQNIKDTVEPGEVAGNVLGDCGVCESEACTKNSMTEGWLPGKPRPLYGFGAAVKGGFAGYHCRWYRVDGRKKFTRFFKP